MSDSGEMDLNETIEGELIGWVDEYNPILKTDQDDEISFDIGGLPATENGTEVTSFETDFRLGDRLRVTKVNKIEFLKRGKGSTYEDWSQTRGDE